MNTPTSCTSLWFLVLLFCFLLCFHVGTCVSITPQYTTLTVAGSMYMDTISDHYALSEYVPLSKPSAAVMNEKNELFVADTNHHVIRVLYPNSTSRVYAGLGTAGFNGDGMHALLTQFHTPIGLSLTPNGDLYVADSGNGRVRKISASTRIVTTLISNQELSTPVGVFAMTNGDVYVTDSTKGLVKHYNATTGIVSLVAGGGSASRNGALATNTKLVSPYGIHVMEMLLLSSILKLLQFFRQVKAQQQVSSIVQIQHSYLKSTQQHQA
ncbi:hypothetical protein C9374_010804 [Naegleria lovaniensis]|uniref:NHL repeat-containing protein n=1 Tax=Naegleria lovaniensis TaxID=51637 RepID=A0AA88GB61_NAELO|nr:uncharacterized protein C9374_010804 [Naegleria lovaniensis]KAG2374520.1 hypothetical protein C9374_010804 [Naegleria lovaniensis]